MHLHIHDHLRTLRPGAVLRLSEDDPFALALERLVGASAARRILAAVGETGILGMSAEELASVARIPARAAERVVAAREIGEIMVRGRRPDASCLARVLDLLPPGLSTLEFEVLLAIVLDGRYAAKAVLLLSKGGAHGTAVTPGDLFMPIVRTGGHGFILVHNHPSGTQTPSDEDVIFTEHVARAGALLGIRLIDHLIVARGGVTSMLEAGLVPSVE